MIIANVLIDNKKEIMDFVNRQIPVKHLLIKNGFSTFHNHNFKDEKVLSIICEIFKELTHNEFDIIELWFNKYHKGGYVESHRHDSEMSEKELKKRWLTGVYYFKKPNNSGNLVINDKKIDIKEDDFVVFDITDAHHTTKNMSKEDRIVFSLNMKEKN